MRKQVCAGILAHVDAGKTTLAEAILYRAGLLRTPGRVDHGDTALDTHPLERRRGITIFSAQAGFSWGEGDFTLLDTPGHADFSGEMERTLGVIDLAVLVISGSDGVQAHTETLWRLLRRYRKPVLLFVTKMDLAAADRQRVLSELREKLDERVTDFSVPGGRPEDEALALCREMARQNLTMADFDADAWFETIENEEKQGKRFLDFMGDVADDVTRTMAFVQDSIGLQGPVWALYFLSEEGIRKRYEAEADRILSKIYNTSYMSASEKQFMAASQETLKELMELQQTLGNESSLTPERSQLIASQIIERVTNEKKKALMESKK